MNNLKLNKLIKKGVEPGLPRYALLRWTVAQKAIPGPVAQSDPHIDEDRHVPNHEPSVACLTPLYIRVKTKRSNLVGLLTRSYSHSYLFSDTNSYMDIR